VAATATAREIAAGAQTGGVRPAERFSGDGLTRSCLDPEQRYLYVGDNQNHKIMIYRRRDLQLLGSIPTDTGANHYITVDSTGNIYNSRLQKFVFKGVPTLNELLSR